MDLSGKPKTMENVRFGVPGEFGGDGSPPKPYPGVFGEAAAPRRPQVRGAGFGSVWGVVEFGLFLRGGLGLRGGGGPPDGSGGGSCGLPLGKIKSP